MLKINGRRIAEKIISNLKEEVFLNKRLVAIVVGDSAPLKSFLSQKKKVALELGVDFQIYEFDEYITQSELEKAAERLNNDERVGGIIIQLPLPKGIDRGAIIEKLSTEKDVDNLTGEAKVLAPTAAVVRDILDEINWNWDNKIIAVVGQGLLVGQPVTRWVNGFSLSAVNLTIKTADINTRDLRSFMADADLVISGVGKKNLINPEWLKEGAGVIDFGFPSDLDNSKLKDGDARLRFYTPNPGGTGPILVAELFRNFYNLNT